VITIYGALLFYISKRGRVQTKEEIIKKIEKEISPWWIFNRG